MRVYPAISNKGCVVSFPVTASINPKKQVGVMGPCTFLVTAVVTGSKDTSVGNVIKDTWAKKGIKGFYPGGTGTL